MKPTLSEEGGSECLVEVLKREGCTISLMRSRRHHPTKGDMGSNESGREVSWESSCPTIQTLANSLKSWDAILSIVNPLPIGIFQNTPDL